MRNITICIIGLGYVGLPLAAAFGRKYQTFGFDASEDRISDLKNGIDYTLELSSEELKSSKNLRFINTLNQASESNFFIVTVPTPIDEGHKPDLSYLEAASESISKYLKKGDCVVYESTTFPGCTREICVPILESGSGLKFNEDFYCGYSPERINPGDKEHRLENILKIVSGSNPDITKKIESIYSSIISAGVYVAPSIEVAEAAKVIENAQRDLNIAFVNELALIFDKFNLDTSQVLKAASTKWNFLDFKPGLVGGHCIGVDPYYLTYQAEKKGYLPEVILSGRRLNDSMAEFVANKTIKQAITLGINISQMRVAIIGLSFKENCPDIRNSKVFDIIETIRTYGIEPLIFDDWVNEKELMIKTKLKLSVATDLKNSNIFILATPHKSILDDLDSIIDQNLAEDTQNIIFDVKSVLPNKYKLYKNLKIISL